MRIALLVTDLELGGTPLRIAACARGLCAAGATVAVAALSDSGPVGHQLAAAGIPVFAADVRTRGVVRGGLHLARQLAGFRPQLLHASLFHANAVARLLGPLLGARVLTSTVTIERERRWHAPLERMTARLDDGHIVNSVALADHVVAHFGRPPTRVFEVPPAVHQPPRAMPRAAARTALEIPGDAFMVLWAGRLDPVKRLDALVACAELLHQEPTRVCIVGEGPQRQRLTQLLNLSSARDCVVCPGWVTDLSPYYAAADALLLPSQTEGLPNVVLEALWAGVPVVAGDLPTLRPLAAATGAITLVADPRPHALANALRELRRDPTERARQSDAARTWARTHLTLSKTIAALLEIYAERLAAARQPYSPGR